MTDIGFKDQPWTQRFGTLGDPAEQRFEQFYEGNWERWGLNRPNLSMKMLPNNIRHAPDYITSHGFVECKGLGRDQVLKVKHEEIDEAWGFWNQIMPLRVFVFDSHNDRHTIIDYSQILWMANDHGTVDHFPDNNKPYYRIPAEAIFDD